MHDYTSSFLEDLLELNYVSKVCSFIKLYFAL